MRSSSQCAERSGFLFKHRCDRMGQRDCPQCGKRICQYHAVSVDTGLVQDGSDSLPSGNGLVCTGCAKRIRKSSRRSEQGYYYDSHPYFYGDRHYHGWGHHHSAGAYSAGAHSADAHSADASSGGEPAYDANDLTEADGEATEIPGDEGFETDMEGS